MCSSKIKSGHVEVAQIDGRPVLQPACNRVTVSFDPVKPSLKKTFHKSISMPASVKTAQLSSVKATTSPPPKISPPVSPTAKMTFTKPVLKRCNSLNSSTEKLVLPKSATTKTTAAATTPALVRKKSKKFNSVPAAPLSVDQLLSAGSKNSHSGSTLSTNFLFWSDMAPGALAAAQREQASLVQAQRKMKIAHYGRTPAKLEGKVVPVDSTTSTTTIQEEKRCSFITANSDPIYVAYHDEEWGVPVHDDRMLFELLVLTGAQVGSDWTTILKKRNEFREAFAGFDAEIVAGFTEKMINSIITEYGIDPSKVRGAVDNANKILEVKKDFGSLDNYLWGFINYKPIVTNYKYGHKIPVKTSKSESISKDLIRRGFRFVGPTVVHSFMQAAGLTNDHLISCPRHRHCSDIVHIVSGTTY